MRASALAVCSYIDDVTGSGATATVMHQIVVNDGAAAGRRQAGKACDHEIPFQNSYFTNERDGATCNDHASTLSPARG